MTIEQIILTGLGIACYLVTVIIMRELFIIKLKPLPDWLAQLFWWAVLPANILSKIGRVK